MVRARTKDGGVLVINGTWDISNIGEPVTYRGVGRQFVEPGEVKVSIVEFCLCLVCQIIAERHDQIINSMIDKIDGLDVEIDVIKEMDSPNRKSILKKWDSTCQVWNHHVELHSENEPYCRICKACDWI